MTSIATISSLQTKDSLSPTHAPSRSFAYPSPTLSPVASFQSAIDAADYRRRTSAKELMASVNPPASPLDALVMALEATAESMAERSLGGQQFASLETTTRTDQDEDEDPNATVPSSPTFFIKAVNVLSLHQLPSLALPEAAVVNLAAPSTHSTNEPTSPLFSPTFNLTPSTRSVAGKSLRKMSVSSQDSADSFSSTSTSGDRHKSFSCSVTNCEKKFYQIAHLRIHERCHTGTRPFVCRYDGCERSFTQLGNLKTHERKHTGERPYRCQHPGCDKTFTQLGNLKTHEHIHDEVKPFMCRLAGCGKTFSQLGNLKTHTTKMHPDAAISDEELAVKTAGGFGRSEASRPDRTTRKSSNKEHNPAQVVAHFNPYQRRPIHPHRSEREYLFQEIWSIIQHQEQCAMKQDSESRMLEVMEEEE